MRGSVCIVGTMAATGAAASTTNVLFSLPFFRSTQHFAKQEKREKEIHTYE